MKIMIACPVHNREWILDEYLLYLYNLDYNKKDIVLYWIVNNTTDGSLNKLMSFSRDFKDEYNNIIIEVYNNPKYRTDNRDKITRRTSTYYWLAELRNKLLNKCVELDCDYLLSCDSDILMRYDTVTQLLSHNNPVVSALVYNGYLVNRREPWRFPNILNIENDKPKHIVSKWTKEPWLAKKGKTLKVDFTGACILINKDMCSKAKYDYYRLGEDEAFCREARKYCDILCDVSLLNIHIMSNKMLKETDYSLLETYLTGGWK